MHRSSRINTEFKRQAVLEYLTYHDGLSYIEARGRVTRLYKGPELEAHYRLAVQWREQGDKHVLDPEVFKKVLNFNAQIRGLQEERDAEIATYCKGNKITYQSFEKAYGLVWVAHLRELRVLDDAASEGQRSDV